MPRLWERVDALVSFYAIRREWPPIVAYFKLPFMQICKLVINDCFQISKLIKTWSKWTNLNVLWQLGTWRRGTGPPTLPRTWRLQPAVGWRRSSNFGAFFAFITARQGGCGQEQEGGTGCFVINQLINKSINRLKIRIIFREIIDQIHFR